MIIECDGWVQHDSESTVGECESCGTMTDRQVKSWHDSSFRYECDSCDPVSSWTPYEEI